MSTTIITGTGIFTWDGRERRSDRYGVFALDKTDYNETARARDVGWTITRAELADLTGLQASIKVEVLETRQSGHIGDFFRGIFPETPDVGEVIDLGTGELFADFDRMDWAVGGFGIGLKPADGRENDWFDPRKLYRLHDQTVRVTVQVTT